jgi:phage terminase large subunit-like protein
MTTTTSIPRDAPRDGAFWYDADAAERAVEWFPKHLVHVEGPLTGQPLELQPWQADKIVRPLYGWKRAHDHSGSDKCSPSKCRFGRRRYRKFYNEIPRGNGKSTIGSAIALKGLIGDRQLAPQIVGAATDRNTGNIIFGYAAKMVRHNAALSQRLRILDATKRILRKSGDGLYMVLSADASRAHGFHPTLVVFDELHAQPNRELYDVLSTSQITIADPLFVMFTTAGYDKKSICGEMHDHALRVLNEPSYDEEFLPLIYAIDEDDDWTDPAIWAKANPNMGVSVFQSAIEKKVEEARQNAAYQNTVLRLHFNRWTTQDVRWMDMAAWDRSAGMVVPHELKGRRCYGGLDLASTTDLAAFALVFPPLDGDPNDDGKYEVLMRFYVPQESIEKRSRLDGVPYDAWVRDGLMTATPGNAIDFGYIEEDILRLAKDYNIEEIGFDRWGAVQLTQDLDREGLTVVPIGQGFRDMSAPTKELQRLVLGQRLVHGGNAVLRWNADNLVVLQDPAGNIKPAKDKSTEKIDGCVALIMAVDRAMRNRRAPSVGVWFLDDAV